MSAQRPGDIITHQQETEQVIDTRLAQSGSGLPDWITIDEDTRTMHVTGRVHIMVPAAEDLADGDTGLDQLLRIVGDPNDTQDAIAVSNTDNENPSTGFNMGVDSFGYVLTTGFDVSNDFNAKVLRATASKSGGRTQDVAQVLESDTGSGLRIDKDGNLLGIQNNTVVFKVDASDGTVHIKTGGSVVADL